MGRNTKHIRRLPREVRSLKPEDALYRVLDQAPVGAAVISLNWHALQVNEEFCRITGYREDELLGMKFTDVNASPDVTRDVKGIEPPAAQDAAVAIETLAAHRPDGGTSSVREYSAPRAPESLALQAPLADQRANAPVSPTPSPTGLTPPEWRAVEERYLTKLCRSGAPVRYEKELLRKDGSRVPVEVLVHTVCGDGGAPSCYYAFVTDLTQRRCAQQELAASETLFRGLVENANGVFYMLSSDGTINYVSPAVESVLGYAPAELVGRNYLEIIADEDKEAVRIAWDDVLRGRLYPSEYRIRRKSGEQCWVRTSSRPHVENGRRVGIRGTLIDLTDRKRAEEALMESEEKYRQLFTVESGAIVLVDAEGLRFVDVNQSAEKLYGWTKEEFLTLTVANISAEPDRTVVDTGRVALGELTWVPLRYHRRKNGEVFPVEISAGTFTLRDRRIVCAVMRDITERVRSTQALADYQKRLRTMASEKALSEERERRRIAVGLHDQIGQSLALVCMRLERLAETTGATKQGDEFREMLGRLGEALKATRTLTFELSPQILYEFGLVPAVAALGQELQQRHGVSFSTSCEGEVAGHEKDVLILLYQSIRELLTNVIKHSRARRCHISFFAQSDGMVINVQDDGIGFDPDAARLQGASRRSFGLFSIQERLHGLGGGMEIESRPRQGTLVTLWVPRTRTSTDLGEESP